MSDPPAAPPAAPSAATARLCWLAFWMSLSILAFELFLMRLLLIASWHHFAFLVISVVLLGFGASGTVLSLVGERVKRHHTTVLFTLSVLTAITMPLATTLAQRLPVEARLVAIEPWRALGWWCLYWSLLATPVFLGAMAVCTTLMVGGRRLALVYGSNLIGSGLGAALAPVLMIVVSPSWLPLTAGLAALLGGAASIPHVRARVIAGLATALVATSLALALLPPTVAIDPYKYAAHLTRLAEQGEAEIVAQRHGPRGLVEAWRSDALHDIPFLGVGVTPPPITVITIDGHWAGSILEVTDADQAAVVDNTMMAFPYALRPARQRVALLDEIGGANAWVALRHDASVVDVVQPHRTLLTLLRGPLRELGGVIAEQPGVRTFVATLRHFLEQGGETYDIIQLVGLEGSAAGSGGIGGLAENHLVTVEGLATALARLRDDGIVFACRGIQTPPRDNLKLLLTFDAALRTRGIEQTGRHVLIVRDYLAVCTIMKVTPWTAGELVRVREMCRTRQLTPIWFTGVRGDELNRPDELNGPADEPGDWYHHAARRVFAGDADALIDAWAFDIRPPTDDRPFFADFSRMRTIEALREAFGDLWLTRAELGFLFVLAAGIAIAVVGAVLTLLPLHWLSAESTHGARSRIAVYFACIGLGYLMVEMVCLSRIARLVGDPVIGAAVTIAGFLVFSGVGSLLAQRIDAERARPIRMATLAVVVAGVATLTLTRFAPAACGEMGLGLVARCGVALLLIAPLAVLMGFPMPLGLTRLTGASPSVIPWAWGVNGFASVLAPPLATLMAMTWGFTAAGAAGVLFYALAAACPPAAPSRPAG